jgi:hypothetical protein
MQDLNVRAPYRAARWLGVMALVLACSWAPVRAAVPTMAGWTLRFADDFNGAAGTQPSTAIWSFARGHGYPGENNQWGTHEIESYTRRVENIGLDGQGHLRITALRDRRGRWTSARIETRRDDFAAPANGILRIQARIRMPQVHGLAALGYWPAFWALGHSFREHRDWPAAGEVDVAENVNGLDRVWGTLHCGVYPGGPCHEKTGLSAHAPCPGSSCQAAFHTYAAEWERSTRPEQIRWYVDGKLYHTISQDQLPAKTWSRMSAPDGMFLLLNLAIGGDFPDKEHGSYTPTPTTEPGHSMLVDYVAVWTRVPPAAGSVAR